MAGGKETPRQKLIGLMYLVLLALLALQVSSAIMEKFLFLEKSLAAAKDGAQKRNIEAIEQLKEAVKKRNNQATDLDILAKSENIHKSSKEIIDYIEGIKQNLIKVTGGFDDHHQYVGAKEETKVEVELVGPEGKKNGKGYELKKKLDSFYDDFIKVIPANVQGQFSKLAMNGSEDPMFKDNPEQKKKDYVELNFAQTPMCAVMAVLTDKQNQIATYEALALAELGGSLGAKEFKLKRLFPVVSAKSSVVAAGTDYEADMFISGEITGVTPTMKFRGAPLKVENLIGKVKFKVAPAGNYDKDGNAKSTWDGSITVQKPTGGDTTYTVKTEYTIAKPVIDVQAGAVSALYVGCGNPLKINVPALGASYKPAFSATNATLDLGSDKGSVTVYPSSMQPVKIKVSSDGSAIGDKEFQVKPVPAPQIVATVGGRDANVRQGERVNIPSIVVKIKPDPGFETALPTEAKYTIVDGKVDLIRGRKPVGSSRKVGSNGVIRVQDLNPTPGDVVMLEVVKLARINSKGQQIDVPMSVQASIVRIPMIE